MPFLAPKAGLFRRIAVDKDVPNVTHLLEFKNGTGACHAEQFGTNCDTHRKPVVCRGNWCPGVQWEGGDQIMSDRARVRAIFLLVSAGRGPFTKNSYAEASTSFYGGLNRLFNMEERCEGSPHQINSSVHPSVCLSALPSVCLSGIPKHVDF
jgi:hypothetical protein